MNTLAKTPKLKKEKGPKSVDVVKSPPTLNIRKLGRAENTVYIAFNPIPPENHYLSERHAAAHALGSQHIQKCVKVRMEMEKADMSTFLARSKQAGRLTKNYFTCDPFDGRKKAANISDEELSPFELEAKRFVEQFKLCSWSIILRTQSKDKIQI